MNYNEIKEKLKSKMNLLFKYLNNKLKYMKIRKFVFYTVIFLGLEIYGVLGPEFCTFQNVMAAIIFLLMIAINFINYRFQWLDDYEPKDYFDFWTFEFSQMTIWLATNILLIHWYSMIHNPISLKIVGGLLGCSQLVLWHRKIKYFNGYFKRLIHISFMFLFGVISEYTLYAIDNSVDLTVLSLGNLFALVYSYLVEGNVLGFIEFIILCIVNMYFLSLVALIKEDTRIVK